MRKPTGRSVRGGKFRQRLEGVGTVGRRDMRATFDEEVHGAGEGEIGRYNTKVFFDAVSGQHSIYCGEGDSKRTSQR